MKFIKIVQSGDFHLDSPLSLHHLSFRHKRREELLHAFKNVVDFAQSEQAHLLLLTGDLFDSQRVTKKTVDFIIQCLASFSGRVFISPGNHDPVVLGGIYDEIKFPDNTHIFKKYDEVHLEELDCVVCGQGFTSDYCDENLLYQKVAPSIGSIKILVMHGEVSTYKNPYNPITKESIEGSQFNYIALGHRHEFSTILRSGETSYAYAGIPEGRGFDEQGDKGVIVGNIYAHGVNLTFKKLCQRIYTEIEVDISACITHADMIESIKIEMKNKKTIYKVNLVGELPSYISVDLKYLEEILLRNEDDITLYDKTRVYKGESTWGERSIQRLFLKAVDHQRGKVDCDEVLLEEVQNLGLRILGGEKI